MSAGSGIRHSEHNREDEPTLLFQIWIAPKVPGGEPRWSNRRFPRAGRSGQLVVLASGYLHDRDALLIRADARILGATMMAGECIAYPLGEARRGYLVPSNGRVDVNGVRLAARDGALIRDEGRSHPDRTRRHGTRARGRRLTTHRDRRKSSDSRTRGPIP
jgi:redox-sensitive bicupin YhaK (pirin superfamily)